MSDEEIVIPQMIGFDKLVKIIIAYLKVGATEEPKGYSNIASVAKVAANNVRLNAKFLKYIGILEGERGSYRLTDKGKRYAQALDWGKLGEANPILKETLEHSYQKAISSPITSCKFHILPPRLRSPLRTTRNTYRFPSQPKPESYTFQT